MAYSDEVLADTPVGYWRLDDTSGSSAADSSGNARAGTYVGSPTLGSTSLLASGGGTAVALNGTSQRITRAHHNDFNIIPTSGFTFECWVKLDNPSSAALQVIADKTNLTTANNQWAVYWDNRNVGAGTVDAIRFRYSPAASGIMEWSGTSVRDALAVGGHLACVKEVSGPARIYWNGTQVATAVDASGLGNTQTLSFGARSDGTGFYLAGTLDEVAIYQSALSATRIAEHYSAGSSSGLPAGPVAVTLPALSASVDGVVTLPAGIAASLPSLSASLDGTVAGVTSGTVEATLPSLSVAVDGTLPAPTTGEVAATLPRLSARVADTAGTSAQISLGLGLEVLDLQLIDVVDLGTVTVPLAFGLDVADLIPVVPVSGAVNVPLGLSLIARPDETVSPDPRTGSPQWRYVVTDLANIPLGELPRIEHGDVEDGVNEPGKMPFTIAISDRARALIKPIERKCQVWEGDRLLLFGPILPGQVSDDGDTITYQVHDPSYWWRGGRRLIARLPHLNLLHNGDFEQGLAYWTGGYDSDSIPAAAPAVTIVEEDFSLDTDGVNPVKAAELVGVETVAQTKSVLESEAVFYPNRPFSWEPLAAGFKPGGAAAVDAVANAMPETAGLAVTIIGHTANDRTGSGLALSKRRADAAKARVLAIRPGAVITTQGVGFYEPDPAYPEDSAQQRRVEIIYESTVTVSGKSKQWIRQTVEVTQPKAARYDLELTAAAMLKVVDDWSVADANMVSVKVVARRKDNPSTPWDPRLGEGSTSVSDTDPVERWMPETASVTIPADDRAYLVDVYLYAPAATARYAAVGLFPEEALYFWGIDQALHVKGIVEHMQDTAYGHGDLGVTPRTPLTGILRDRIFSFRELMPVDTALDGYSSLNRGLDIEVVTTPTEIFIDTHYPRLGQVVDYALVLGGNLVKAVPATTRDVGSSVVAQAQGLGSYRAAAYARDEAAFGGLLLERVITAEQDTPLNELSEVARAELGWAGTPTPAYWVDVHPARIQEVQARVGKGDTVRLVLDFPDEIDQLARVVRRKKSPGRLSLMLALEEA